MIIFHHWLGSASDVLRAHPCASLPTEFSSVQIHTLLQCLSLVEPFPTNYAYLKNN